MSDSDKRNFVLRDSDGNESSVFSGSSPRQAALKAARRLPSGDTEDEAEHVDIQLRERGTDDVHVYDAWAWKVDADEDAPDWVGDTVTEANVSKLRVDHVDNG
ncbi:non-histone chromosomal MC1 family protein [Halopenitus sp. H-Gu1]|uniref:non-histone chromosomal MC1 family protein n=1 Tax=Halopenitus sp. H-Gu1 TaxID=3242697 RepID=UPI00359E286E